MKFSKLFVIISVYGGQFCNASDNIDTNKYDACFNTAEQYYQVPKEILKAIAYVESHYNPNAYNQNTNGTYDIGLMQINSIWLPKLAALNISEQMLYDPCQSVYMGAWILANNIKTYGFNWTAVQRYNGNDIDLKYATKVYNRIQETYPELLSSTRAKLIPMNLKSETILTSSNIAHKSEISTNDITNARIEAAEKDNKDMVSNAVKKNETAQEYTKEVDDILRKSGVRITPQNGTNNHIQESTKELVAFKSNKAIGDENDPKTNSIDSKLTLQIAKSKSVALKNIINEPSFILDFNSICDKKIYQFCDVYFINIVEITPKFLLDKPQAFIKKSEMQHTRAHPHKTPEMLVI